MVDPCGPLGLLFEPCCSAIEGFVCSSLLDCITCCKCCGGFKILSKAIGSYIFKEILSDSNGKKGPIQLNYYITYQYNIHVTW